MILDQKVHRQKRNDKQISTQTDVKPGRVESDGEDETLRVCITLKGLETNGTCSFQVFIRLLKWDNGIITRVLKVS